MKLECAIDQSTISMECSYFLNVQSITALPDKDPPFSIKQAIFSSYALVKIKTGKMKISSDANFYFYHNLWKVSVDTTFLQMYYSSFIESLLAVFDSPVVKHKSGLVNLDKSEGKWLASG